MSSRPHCPYNFPGISHTLLNLKKRRIVASLADENLKHATNLIFKRRNWMQEIQRTGIMELIDTNPTAGTLVFCFS